MKVYIVLRVEDERIAAVFFDERKAKDCVKEKGEWDFSYVERETDDTPPGCLC